MLIGLFAGVSEGQTEDVQKYSFYKTICFFLACRQGKM